MKRKIELLAPGGDLDSIKAAIVAGADAIYCGLDKFNARLRATNITFDDLVGILALAHRHGCRVFLTLNIMMVESDIPVVVDILNQLVNTRLDGVIVQDLGVFYLLSQYFKGLKIHASTQLTTHNEGQIKFLSKLGATRVNLSRELNIREIKPLTLAGHKENISTEVFVHGSYCISFSGICYMSSVHGGNSGNRGRCSQPCRDRYVSTQEGHDFPLNLKDNSAYFDLKSLADAGVDAIKIEGRMKAFHYVYTVTNSYRKQLQSLNHRNQPVDDCGDLYRVFNRGFSNSFMVGAIGRNMFSDHPRNHSATHLCEGNRNSKDKITKVATTEPYDIIADHKAVVRGKIEHLGIAKVPLTVRIAGKSGTPLKVSVYSPDTSFVVSSESCLAIQRRACTGLQLTTEMFLERLKAVNETEYYIDHLELEDLEPGLHLPLRELKLIKKRLLFILNGSRDHIKPIDLPVFANLNNAKTKPTLSLLIASTKDLYLCNETCADILFQLPNDLKRECLALVALLTRNQGLIPWFPSILIGEDYAAAVRLLHQVQPRRIVTNNTGIAYEAWKEKIPWIAGPYLNTANSLSLASLKENFECSGAFVSNELSKLQIKRINPPEDFKLYYSIYHPTLLLTSRQCLFYQVTGCEKDTMDDACISHCEKSSIITNLKRVSFFIKKTKGNYSSIYYQTNFLNTEIVTDFPFLFSSFLIDLRDIETKTKTELDKSNLVQLFENHLGGHANSSRDLNRCILPTTNTLYKKGI
ncbi:MAG: U32 family peptidase [Deltaproteobacteria bacterium]|nr:U32 family peptidase [Deltaproteobacteria bacterium]